MHTIVPVKSVIEGSMRTDRKTDIIQRRVLPQMSEAFLEEGIFHQNNASYHGIKRTKLFLHDHNVPLLDWLLQSSVNNPIENLCALMKRKSGNLRAKLNKTLFAISSRFDKEIPRSRTCARQQLIRCPTE